jgi:hypothetical protein
MLQGEVHGEGIQGDHLGVKGVTLGAFNLFDIAAHAYAGHTALAAFCRATGLPMVREIWRGEFRLPCQNSWNWRTRKSMFRVGRRKAS